MAAEIAILALLLALGALPLVRLLPRVSTRRAAHAAVFVTGLAAAALIAPKFRGVPEESVTDRPLRVPSSGHVTSSACRSCHPHEHATWHASYHRTMTQIATPEAVLAPFDGSSQDACGHRVVLGRSGDDLFIETDDPAHVGSAPSPRQRHRVVMTTGSHHEQVYWHEVGAGRLLGVSRLLWLVPEQRLVPFPFNFVTPEPEGLAAVSSFPGLWNTSCIRCHATNGRPRMSPDGGADTQVSELGIACEACHGPGEAHVRANRNPLRREALHRDDRPDPSIVNPRRLNALRSTQACGQCHGLSAVEVDHETWNREGLAFRAGQDLSETATLICAASLSSPPVAKMLEGEPRFLGDHFWSDGMVRVSGREMNGVMASPCFAGRELSCLSCHEMHPAPDDARAKSEWADDQLFDGMRGNAACTSCHESLASADAATAHSRHAPGSSGNECMNCHMPHTAFGLLKATRSHQVDTPDVAQSVATGRPNACNQCHLDRSLGWTARQLEEWHGIARPALDPIDENVAAAVVHGLRGDAGQRAIAAWSFGWDGARAASPEGMPSRFLAQLLDDPYAAVRIVAWRALKNDPAFAGFDYDPAAPAKERVSAAARAIERWTRSRADEGKSTSLDFLVTHPPGEPEGAAPTTEELLERLLADRDDKLVNLAE